MARDGRSTLKDLFTVARDRSLSVEEKLLWVLIRSHETPDKGAHPGDDRLASMMDRSPRSVQRYRRSLLEAGYLEQQRRGPKPAIYRAVLSTERDDTRGDSLKDSPEDSPSDSPLVSPEYGEYGEETDTGGSSLRSSPPGEDAGAENSREAWRPRLAPLIRDVAYRGKGPPPGHDLARCLSKARQLLESGYSVEDLEDAVQGLRRMAENRDARVQDWIEPGDRFTLLAFGRAEESGERLVQLAAHVWRKNGAGEGP